MFLMLCKRVHRLDCLVFRRSPWTLMRPYYLRFRFFTLTLERWRCLLSNTSSLTYCESLTWSTWIIWFWNGDERLFTSALHQYATRCKCKVSNNGLKPLFSVTEPADVCWLHKHLTTVMCYRSVFLCFRICWNSIDYVNSWRVTVVKGMSTLQPKVRC